MNKIIISLLLVMLMSIAVNAKKQSGAELKHLMDTLLSALGQLSSKSNEKLTVRNVTSSTELPDGDGMLYDVEVFDTNNLERMCKIEVVTLENGESKVVCTCTLSNDAKKPIPIEKV
ncbi:uncharacterized protein ACRADG_001166 [Cochliomyia hominivorax]